MRFSVQPGELSFLDRAPILNTQRITVDAPPEAVWPAFADAAEWVAWWADMSDCHYTSEPPVTAGSTRSVAVASLRVDEVLLAYEPGERYAFTVVAANLPLLTTMVEDVRLAPVDGDRTEITYTQAVALRRWAAPVRRSFERQLRTSLADGLAGLPAWVADRR